MAILSFLRRMRAGKVSAAWRGRRPEGVEVLRRALSTARVKCGSGILVVGYF